MSRGAEPTAMRTKTSPCAGSGKCACSPLIRHFAFTPLRVILTDEGAGSTFRIVLPAVD